ncbi:MAG: hypothetical protein ABI999_03620 [Acidobacteriota bacterium]
MDNDLLENRPTPETTNKRIALLSIAGVLFVFYFFQWYAGDPEKRFQLVDLVFAVFFTVAVFLWCQIDARERGDVIGPFFAIGLLVFGPFAVMYYFFRTRGFQRGLISIAWMFFFGLIVFIASFIELIILANISDRMGLLKDV